MSGKNITGPVAHGNGLICIFQCFLLDSIHVWAATVSRAIVLCCMNMQDKWFSAYLLCPHARGKGHPVMSMNDIKFMCLGNLSCNFGVASYLRQEFRTISPPE